MIRQTKQELNQFLDEMNKQIVIWQYELLDSLNYPEIDFEVRVIRQHLNTFDSALYPTKQKLVRDIAKLDKNKGE